MARLKPRSKALVTSAAKRTSVGAATPLPAFVPPQLATLASAPPEGAGWLHEIKYDGYRAIGAVAGGRSRLYTRSGQDWTDKFAFIAGPLAELKVGSALLDGEIVALDETGTFALPAAAARSQGRRAAHLLRVRHPRAGRARFAR